MLAQERQDKISEMIQKDGAVTAAKLMALFGVSIETVRRDLLVLERGGKLMRVHGGAVAKAGMKAYPTLQQRTREFRAEKYQLSRAAARFVSEGDIISIDAGSTAIAFAEVLKEQFHKLTVVTHSKDVFDLLCNHREFELILCGGQYLRGDNAFCGELTLNMLRSLHTQKAFVFPSAVSIEYGICDFQQELYPVQKQLMRSADQVYILADSSKFEKTGLLKLDDMKPEYIYITDGALPGEAAELYRENGLTLHQGEE
jgi:DeoR/GlpR family transcriptional regulator of sugar metabolism